MIEVKIDEEVVRNMLQVEIEKKVAKLSKGYVFWDTPELKRRTCMSWNTMQEHFFHDPNFPKVKIGGKWYYPAKETEEFLIKWFKLKRRKTDWSD